MPNEPIDLEAIEERLRAARPGPWREAEVDWHVARKLGRTLYAMVDTEPNDLDVLIGMMDDEEDAIFIAHAPTDILSLIAEVRRLTGEKDHAEDRWAKWQHRAEKAEAQLAHALRVVEKSRGVVEPWGNPWERHAELVAELASYDKGKEWA